MPKTIEDREYSKFRNENKVAVTIEQDPLVVIQTSSYAYKTIIDEVNKNLSYVGDAEPSAATSLALWKIRRIETIGAITTVAYADGNSSFDNVWDNRASLTYI